MKQSEREGQGWKVEAENRYPWEEKLIMRKRKQRT